MAASPTLPPVGIVIIVVSSLALPRGQLTGHHSCPSWPRLGRLVGLLVEPAAAVYLALVRSALLARVFAGLRRTRRDCIAGTEQALPKSMNIDTIRKCYVHAEMSYPCSPY